MTPCAPTAGHENEATGREAADSEERDGGDTVPNAVPSALGQSHRVEKPGVAWCEDITVSEASQLQEPFAGCTSWLFSNMTTAGVGAMSPPAF